MTAAPERSPDRRSGRFRKRPVVVEAIQYTAETCAEIHERFGWEHRVYPGEPCGAGEIVLTTIHGEEAVARPGDWIVTEPDGAHHYPVKPDIFAATYEAVDDPPVVRPPEPGASERESGCTDDDCTEYDQGWDDGHRCGLRLASEAISPESVAWMDLAKDYEVEIARLRDRLTAVTRWLEQNKPEVFREGLWDALAPTPEHGDDDG